MDSFSPGGGLTGVVYTVTGQLFFQKEWLVLVQLEPGVECLAALWHERVGQVVVLGGEDQLAKVLWIVAEVGEPRLVRNVQLKSADHGGQGAGNEVERVAEEHLGQCSPHMLTLKDLELVDFVALKIMGGFIFSLFFWSRKYRLLYFSLF